jgi:hypothetical protein
MIYSSERKKRVVTITLPKQIQSNCDHSVRITSEWVVLPILLHVAPVTIGFQLLIFPPLRRAGPSITPSLQTDPISLWIQAISSHFNVGHKYFIPFALETDSMGKKAGEGTIYIFNENILEFAKNWSKKTLLFNWKL